MNIADYNATVYNHSEILINITVEDSISKDISDVVIERFKKHRKLTIFDAGCSINIRFECNPPLENNSWGKFQSHRQVMGLVYIAHAVTAMDVALLHENFHHMKEKYDSTLHSRCLIFGIDTDILKQHSPDVLKFSSIGSWKSYDYDIKEFLTAIFYELEGKRLKLELEKGIKPPLIKAPFEKTNPELDASDNSERRNYRKKCSGRHLKHLADISLLAGKISNALLAYHNAIDCLTQINDTEWVGSALEGLCAISTLIQFPNSDVKQQLTILNKHNSKQMLDPRNLLNNKQSSGPSIEELRKLCLPNMDSIVDRYKEAVINYSRNKNLGVIELEACIKATRILISSKKKLAASEFLQNAVYITLNLSDEERIKRYSILANLYSDIGFKRKSSFFKRVAAMQCVAPHLKLQNWGQCNTLLMDALPGYNINISNEQFQQAHRGWPNIQIRVFHELIFSSKKMGKSLLANRHTLQFLLSMYKQLSDTEEHDICNSLTSNATKISNVDSATYQNGIYSNVSIYTLPLLRTFQILPMPEIYHPVYKSDRTSSSVENVFLYKPSTYSSNLISTSELKWTVNSVCTVRLVFYNPLRKSSIIISNLTLFNNEYIKGFECIPLKFEVSSLSENIADVKLLPIVPGKLVITGYTMCMFGMTFSCHFDKIHSLPSEKIEMKIIPELPLLKLLPGDDYMLNLNENLPNEIELNIYKGEFFYSSIMLSNTSETKVEDIIVSHKCKNLITNISSSNEILIWNDINIESVSNKNLTLPFSINAKNVEWTDNQKFLYEVSANYSGGDAYKQNWYRFLNFNLYINILSCVVMLEISVLPHKYDQSVSVINLKVKNNISKTVSVCYKTLKGKKYVEEESSLSEIFTFEVVIGKLQLWSTQQSFKSENQEVQKYMIKYIKDTIKPEWKINDEKHERTGELNICNLELSSNSVGHMILCPIECAIAEVSIDSGNVNELKTINCKLCQPLYITFHLCNISELSISFDIELCVSQDQYNGYVEQNSIQGIICNGITSRSYKNLKPNEKVHYKISLLPLYQGEYQLKLKYIFKMPEMIVKKNCMTDLIIKQESSIYSIISQP